MITFEEKYTGVSGDQFIGRDDYLKKLNDFIDGKFIPKVEDWQSANNRPERLISIYGMPHVGKTSLLMQWQKLLLNENRQTFTPNGTKLLILSTAAGAKASMRDEESGGEADNKSHREGTDTYYFMLRKLINGMSGYIWREQRKGNIPSEDAYLCEVRDLLDEQRNIVEGDVDIVSATERFKQGVECLNEFGIRVLVIVDEFERAGQSWYEYEYSTFIQLLMNDSLDLYCVVASRPHISYVVENYIHKVCPFYPMLLNPYSDTDMDIYFSALVDNNYIDLTKAENAERLQGVLYACGRNPYLLNRMAIMMLRNSGQMPKDIYRFKRESFYNHYQDVMNFMLYEEAHSERSFTHIVKCYLGNSVDNIDIIENFAELGYVELCPSDSKYVYVDERYVHTVVRAAVSKKYYYTTVCPGFVTYLYRNCLEHVEDVRDILTGFVHTIRDVIRIEMEKKFANDVETDGDWNKALLLRYRTGSAPNQKNNHREGRQYAIQLPNGSWDMIYRSCMNPGAYHDSNKHLYSAAESGFITDRRNWVQQHDNDYIQVGPSGLKYAVTEINKGINDVMPVLDPIGLIDVHGVIKHYYNEFANYFGVLGDKSLNSSKEPSERPSVKLREHLEEIQDARNEISHFSRYGITEEEKALCKKRCIYLLKSMYSYLEDGEVMPEEAFE